MKADLMLPQPCDGRFRRPSMAAGAVATWLSLLSACAAETTVYRYVPEYQLREGIVPERYVRDDGVLVINRPRLLGAQVGADGAPVDPTGRQENPDGTVVLRALLPDQALGHMQQCLLDSDWALMWEQVISGSIRREYEKGGGFDEFVEYMERHRHDLYAMLNRMIVSLRTPEVTLEVLSNGWQRCRFHWSVASQFKFAAIDLVLEEGGLKVAMIHPFEEPSDDEGAADSG